MPTFEIEAPNGQILEIDGDTMPTEQELDDIFKQTGTFGKFKLDLTPSGLLQQGTAGALSPIAALIKGVSIPEAYQGIMQENKNYEKAHPIASAIPKLGVDLYAYGKIPMAKTQNPILDYLANTAIQGTGIGALEGLKNGDVAEGAKVGTGIAGVLPPLLKVGGWTLNKATKIAPIITKAVGRIAPETLEQVVKPTSKALDYTKDEAKNLLLDITQNVRKNYADLLKKKGKQVKYALKELPQDKMFSKDGILNGIDSIYNNYSLSYNPNVNPARLATKKEYNKINEMLDGTILPDSVSAKELYDINQRISDMIRWDDANAKTANDALEQIYVANAKKLSDLSPELKQANKEYADLMDFKNNDAVKQVLNGDLLNEDKIGNAQTALRNYNSTVTSGNKAKNINSLENILVNNGYEPFLNDIDDINAAFDLLKLNVTGDSAKANLLQETVRPGLQFARWANQHQIPETINNISQLTKKLLNPLAIKAKYSPLIYGGISNTEDDYKNFDRN